MPRRRRLACEPAGNDGEAIVPAAALRALVSCVPARFVHDLERFGIELRQPLLDELGGVHSAFLSWMWGASMKACNTTNTSMRPMPPNTLNCTHTASENE